MANRYTANKERGAKNLVSLVLYYRQKYGQIDASLVELAETIEERISSLKDELLNGAGTAYDSFKELQDLIENNKEALDALRELAAGHVKYDGSQSLTASQKKQARTNIDAVSPSEMNTAITNAIPAAPTASVSKVDGVATISITDRFGNTTASVADGERGYHYTPYFEGDNLMFTNDGGLENPAPKNVRGPQGIQGLKGDKGDQGEQGIQGVQGERGPQGFTFKPSISSSGYLSYTNDGGLENPQSIYVIGPKGDKGDKGDTGPQGPQGIQGPAGNDGKDGATGPRGVTFKPSLSSSGILSFTNDGGLENPTAVSLVGPKGDKGDTGPQGPAGTVDTSLFLTIESYNTGFDGGSI